MACCNWGVGLPPPWKHAKYWAGNLAAHPDYQVLANPVAGSIGCKADGYYGHVAWVKSVSGNTVHTREMSCCEGAACWPGCSYCIHGFRDLSYNKGYFTGGFIIRKGSVFVCTPGKQQSAGCGNCGTKTRTCGSNGQWGGWSGCKGQGPCAPGQSQSEACGDCGNRSRGCGGNCQWGGWSACAGPDPAGGTIGCDSGQPGICAEGRQRCVEGWVACAALHEPQPEVCDNLDNDCDGEVDDGSPLEMGEVPPDFAARLVDFSFPGMLAPGEEAAAWVMFENVGIESWQAGQIALAVTESSGQISDLLPQGEWPAWNIAAVGSDFTAPGAITCLEFAVEAPENPGALIIEEFRLKTSAGIELRCPSPAVQLRIAVGPPPAPANPPDTTATRQPDLEHLQGTPDEMAPDSTADGCAASDPITAPPTPTGVLLLLWLLMAAINAVLRQGISNSRSGRQD